MSFEWQKSSFSEDTDGNCIELASKQGSTFIRESNDPGQEIALSGEALRALLTDIKNGHAAIAP